MLFWALLASGQITMRKVDGWQTLAEKPNDQIIDLAARSNSPRSSEDSGAPRARRLAVVADIRAPFAVTSQRLLGSPGGSRFRERDTDETQIFAIFSKLLISLARPTGIEPVFSP